MPIPTDRIAWTHPSYRDLVIEELGHSAEFRAEFLSLMDHRGIALAISSAGGALGLRQFPLLVTQVDWNSFAARVVVVISINPVVGFVEIGRAHV